MVRPLQNVKKAELDESQRRLKPAWIESHEPRIAGKLERSNGPVWQQEAKDGHHSEAQTSERGVDRELRLFGMDRILQPRVNQRLVPRDFCIVRQPRSADMRQRF